MAHSRHAFDDPNIETDHADEKTASGSLLLGVIPHRRTADDAEELEPVADVPLTVARAEDGRFPERVPGSLQWGSRPDRPQAAPILIGDGIGPGVDEISS